MKKALVAVALIVMSAASIAASITEANAVVCARGVYRAGCAGPHGAVGVRRAPAHGAVVVRRPHSTTVYRRY